LDSEAVTVCALLAPMARNVSADGERETLPGAGVAVGVGVGLGVAVTAGVGVAVGIGVAVGVAVAAGVAVGVAVATEVGVAVATGVGLALPAGVGDAPGTCGTVTSPLLHAARLAQRTTPAQNFVSMER
jgi:hypothetical protein